MSVFGMFKSRHNLCPYLDIRCPRHATRACLCAIFSIDQVLRPFSQDLDDLSWEKLVLEF